MEVRRRGRGDEQCARVRLDRVVHRREGEEPTPCLLRRHRQRRTRKTGNWRAPGRLVQLRRRRLGSIVASILLSLLSPNVSSTVASASAVCVQPTGVKLGVHPGRATRSRYTGGTRLTQRRVVGVLVLFLFLQRRQSRAFRRPVLRHIHRRGRSRQTRGQRPERGAWGGHGTREDRGRPR